MARNRQRAKDRKQNLHRENIPGSLDNASAEVDAIEARIVAGAEGVPVDDGIDFDAEEIERERHGGGGGGGDEIDDGHAAGSPARQPSGSRLLNFLRACWAELQRVQWPDRRQVGQATAVVLGFVVVAGAFLGLADVIAQKIVDLIL